MKKAVSLHLLPTPKTPWEEISIDVIGPLPKSEDKDAILVVVDQFSKMIRLMATTTSIFSNEVARIYWDNIWKIHSILSRTEYRGTEVKDNRENLHSVPE